MAVNTQSSKLLPPDRARDLVDTLTEGDVEFLIRQTRARIRRDRKRAGQFVPAPGKRDANEFKIQRAEDLADRLVSALGRDPDE